MKTKYYINFNKFWEAGSNKPKYKNVHKKGEKWEDVITVFENEGAYGPFLTVTIDWDMLKQWSDAKGKPFILPQLGEPQAEKKEVEINPDDLPF